MSYTQGAVPLKVRRVMSKNGPERERKYRIISWTSQALQRLLIGSDFTLIKQGFFSIDPACRVRLSWGFNQGAEFTIKTGHNPLDRFEENIPLSCADGLELLELAPHKIEKLRFTSGRFEIDFFLGPLKRREMLEIELKYADEKVELPEGLELQEVTHDPKYLNVHLAQLTDRRELDDGMRGSLTIANIDDGLNYCQQAIASRIQKAEKLPVIIGVSGSSASGKSLLAEELKKQFGDDATVLDMDSYFIGKEQMKKDGVDIFDDPRAIDLLLLHKHIMELAQGNSILKPVYSFQSGERETHEHFSAPRKLLIVEGLFALHPAFNKLYDFSIFVDVSIHGALWRGIKRDTERSGETPSEIFTRVAREVYPAYKLHVDYQRYFADVIINNDMDPAVEMTLEKSRQAQVKVFLFGYDAAYAHTDGAYFYMQAKAMLKALGFQEEARSPVIQHDLYFSAPFWGHEQTDEFVRVRSDYCAGFKTHLTLAYKGPRDANTRGLIQFEIDKDCVGLLKDLDYHQVNEIIKKRNTFVHPQHNVEITLDCITQSSERVFLEIRGENAQDVENMAKELQEYGIAPEQFTDASYIEILFKD